jgi:hypothetical protein
MGPFLGGAQTKNPDTKCPDITYRDKTSGGKKSGETKYPEGQNVRQTKHLWGQNIQIHNICGTKRPWGQNVCRDKTSGDITSVWIIFLMFMLGNIFTEKSLERGGKIPQYMHFLCSCLIGG